MNKLLYFPYISLPNNQWVSRTLLYWEEVASIVPFDFISRPHMLGQYMRELVHNGLVKQIIPEQYVYDFNDFEANFFNYIENDSFFNHLSALGQLGELGNGKILRTQKVHMGKMRYLGDELVRRGLAKPCNDWFEVEEYTANSFMIYLAILIGNKTQYVPSTDRYNGFNNILARTNDVDIMRNTKRRVRDELRANILEKILPVPEGNIDCLELLRFKDRHSEELVRYRNYVENFLIDLDAINIEYKDERVKRFLEESKEEVESIKEKLSVFGSINLDFISLCSISSAIFPVVDAINSGNQNSLAGAIPGLLGAIYSTLRSSDHNEIRRQPLAYAAITSRDYNRFRRNIVM